MRGGSHHGGLCVMSPVASRPAERHVSSVPQQPLEGDMPPTWSRRVTGGAWSDPRSPRGGRPCLAGAGVPPRRSWGSGSLSTSAKLTLDAPDLDLSWSWWNAVRNAASSIVYASPRIFSLQAHAALLMIATIVLPRSLLTGRTSARHVPLVTYDGLVFFDVARIGVPAARSVRPHRLGGAGECSAPIVPQ